MAPATILTLLLFPIALANHHLAAADRAGADFQYLFVCGPRWMLLAAVLAVVLRRGGFDWLGRSRLASGSVVLVAHTGAGILSLLSLMTLQEGGATSFVGALVFALLVPILLMAYCGYCLRRPSIDGA